MLILVFFLGQSKLFLVVKAPSSLNLPHHFLPKRDFRHSKKVFLGLRLIDVLVCSEVFLMSTKLSCDICVALPKHYSSAITVILFLLFVRNPVSPFLFFDSLCRYCQ